MVLPSSLLITREQLIEDSTAWAGNRLQTGSGPGLAGKYRAGRGYDEVEWTIVSILTGGGGRKKSGGVISVSAERCMQ